MSQPVDGQLLVDALTEQRNRAMDGAAVALARSVHFQRECERLQMELEDLKAKQKKGA